MDMPWIWNSLTSDWPATVKAVIGAGLGTILAQWAVPVLHDWRKRKAHATYMAMRVAVVLEAYAAACTDVIFENNQAERLDDEEFPRWDVHLPDLQPYPNDEEGWRALDRKLASRALDLRNRIVGSQGLIRSTIEHDESHLKDTLDAQMSGRGWEAWSIAHSLRKRHGVEFIEPVWDYAEHLRSMRGAAEGDRRVPRWRRPWSRRHGEIKG